MRTTDQWNFNDFSQFSVAIFLFRSILPVNQIEEKLEKAIFGDPKSSKNRKSLATRIKIALVDTDKIVTTQLDEEIVKKDIKEIATLLTATTDVYKLSYLYNYVYPLPNFSVNDKNKAKLGEAGAIGPLLDIVATTTPINYMVAAELPKSRILACKARKLRTA